MQESWGVLRRNPSLMAFPAISAVFTLIALVGFAIPIGLLEGFKDFETIQPALYIPISFGFYFVTSFIVIFFNSGLVACAHKSLMGQDVTMGDGLNAAVKRMPAILGWTLISATVGMILKIIGENLGTIGRIAEMVLGIAWSIVTYFVIPIVVIEQGSPVSAIKESAGMFKKTWGERLVGGAGMGLAFAALMLGPLPIFIAVCITGSALIILPALALMVLWWIALGMAFAAMQGVYQTALYVYASSGATPAGFERTDFSAAFRSKPSVKDRWGSFLNRG